MRTLFTLALVLFHALAFAQTIGSAPDESQTRLPVRRVVLYKNGVGHFEHRGRITGNQEIPFHFTTAQLDDVLKSLTVLDLGEGQVTSVRFNTMAPLSERLEGLRIPFGEQTTRMEMLKALRGARVEVRAGSVIGRGRLVTVERLSRSLPNAGGVAESIVVGLLTETGEMRTLEIGPSARIQLLDAELREDVRRLMGVLSTAQSSDMRRVSISAAGTGEREVLVSYISEVPVWKSTYRIVLPEEPDRKPLLQGWAIVDNTLAEDWDKVQLSLVAGAPQSFVQPISQPQYIRRPEVGLSESVQLTPQAHEGTMAKLSSPAGPPPVGTASLSGYVRDPAGAVISGASVTLRNEANGMSQMRRTGADGRYYFSNVPAGPASLFVDASGFARQVHSNFFIGIGRSNEIHTTLNVGSMAETVEVMAAATTVQTMASTISGVATEAEVTDTGTLFRYDLKQRISIGKNQSALVPILQTRIEAEKVTLWSPDARVPLHALWVTNTSDYTLDAGSFNVVESGTFAGEGLLEPLKPQEKRLLSYAADTAVRVKVTGEAPLDDDEDDEDEEGVENVTRVRVANGVLYITRQSWIESHYQVRNSDTKPRNVLIEHPASERWRLADGLKPEEASPRFYRFRVPVEAAATADLKVRQFRAEVEDVALTSVTEDSVALLVRARRVDAATEQAIRSVLARKAEIAGMNAQLSARRKETDEINGDQARLRENMKALKGSAEEKELLKRYTRELNAQEDRLASLRRELGEMQQKLQEAQKELDRFIQAVAFEGV